ncbi:MAG: family rane protein Rfbx family [Solirubrobacterales bacterium]|jgi:O-antigen/teichoic acid export membrane protein|nr:family rane protein Rfbx family [Solirubrobacterales bacterium]
MTQASGDMPLAGGVTAGPRPPAARGAGPAPQDDGVARNVAFALATQISSATFTAVLVLYLVRALGPDQYGTLSLALGVAAIVGLPADLGISTSAARFVAEHRGDRTATAAVITSALRLKLAAVAGLTLLLVLAAPLVARAYGEPGLTWPLRGVAIALLGQGVLGFFAAAFIAARRVSANLRIVLCESAVETAASIALVLAGAGAAGAAFGRAIGYATGALVAVVLARRFFGAGALALRRGGGQTRRIMRYAGVLLVVDGAFALFQHVDILVIGAVLGTASVGLYSAPLRLIVLLHYPGLSISSAVAPRLASSAGHAPDVRSLATALRYLIVFQCPIVAVVVVWASPVVELLLGSRYHESAGVLRTLAPFVLLTGLAPLASNAVDYIGEARRRVPIAIATVLLNLAIDLVLIPRIGIIGGAIGTDVAYLLYVPAHIWICHARVGLALRPLLSCLARSLLSALAMAGVLLALGTSGLSLLDWCTGLAGGTAAYLAVALLTRALTPADLRLARDLLRRGRLRASRATS